MHLSIILFLSTFMLPFAIKYIHKNSFSTVGLIPKDFTLSTSNKCYSKQRNIKYSWNFPLCHKLYEVTILSGKFLLFSLKFLPLSNVSQMAPGINARCSLYNLYSISGWILLSNQHLLMGWASTPKWVSILFVFFRMNWRAPFKI